MRTTFVDVDVAVELVELARIRPGLNARPQGELGNLEDLAASIREKGVLQAIIVRPVPADSDGRDLEIVCGERRWRAARLVPLSEIPATVREMDATEARTTGLLENLQRHDVSPLAQAEGFRILSAAPFALTPAEIGRRVGKPAWFVEKAIEALSLPKALLDAVRVDRVSYAAAQQLLRVSDPTVRAQAAKAVVDELRYRRDLGVADVRETVVRHLTRLDEAPFDVHDAGLVASAGACDECLFRSANLARTLPLFGDADPEEGDTCTQPRCYRAKADAHFERQAAAVRAAGGTVLASAKKLFYDHDQARVRPDAAHVDLDAPYDAAGGKKSLRALLGDKLVTAAVVLAQDGRGGAHHLVPKKAVPKLLEQAGVKTREDRFGGGLRVNVPLSEREKADRRRKQLQAAIETDSRRAILDAVFEAARRVFASRAADDLILAGRVWRFVVSRLVHGLHQEARAVAVHRGYQPKPGAGYDAAERWLDKALEPASALDCMELMLALALETGRTHFDGPSVGHEVKAAELLGVDAKGIRTSISSHLSAKHKEREAARASLAKQAGQRSRKARGAGKATPAPAGGKRRSSATTAPEAPVAPAVAPKPGRSLSKRVSARADAATA